MALILPPEVCIQIARHTAHNDLPALCLISRTFQSAAEAELYDTICVYTIHAAYQVCQALLTNDGLRGPYVHKFLFNQDTRRFPQGTVDFPESFWIVTQQALTAMVNLDYLYLRDPSGRNGWVLNTPGIKFQVTEAAIIFSWNADIVAFLRSQSRLRCLQVEDSLDDAPLVAIGRDQLQTLRILQCPVLVLTELLTCPLTHVRIGVDQDTAALIPTVISDLGRIRTGLRSLCLTYLPEQLVLETLQLISTSVFVPTLRYLGVLSYPMNDRYEIHRCLVQMRALSVIELDVMHWMPVPAEPFQRMLAAELRTFCPSLIYVGFWVGHHHVMWRCAEEEWSKVHMSARSPFNESTWRNI